MSEDDKASDNPGLATSAREALSILGKMNRNMLRFASLGRLPGSSDASQPLEVLRELAKDQLRLSIDLWRIYNQTVLSAVDASWSRLDASTEKSLRAFELAIQRLTGIELRDIARGRGEEWSPHHVNLQSLGLSDSEVVDITAEMIHFATASSETGRAMFDLYRVVGDAWMRAAYEFAYQSIDSGIKLNDLKALRRKWAATAEPILQEALGSEAFVSVNTGFFRAASRQAKARSVMARRFTDLIEAPSRQEMNETYEALQEMRREIQRLRRNQKRLERELAATSDASSKKQV